MTFDIYRLEGGVQEVRSRHGTDLVVLGCGLFNLDGIEGEHPDQMVSGRFLLLLCSVAAD